MNVNNPNLVLISWGLFTLIWLFLGNALKKPFSSSPLRVFLGTLTILIFCIYAFYDSDYFHYKAVLKAIINGNSTHVEEFYKVLSKWTGDNYSLFRLLIWGPALLLFYSTIKRLKLPIALSLLIFSSLFITLFAYGRVALAISVIFYGLSLIVSPLKSSKILSIIIGIVLLACSYFLHKSSIFGILIVVISMIPYTLKRNQIRIFLISYPFLITLAALLLNNLSTLGLNSILDVETTQYYLNTNASKSGLGRLIQSILTYSPYYLGCYITLLNVWNKSYRNWPRSIKAFSHSGILITVISTLFAFDLNANTSIIYYRFLYFGMIPFSIILTFLWQKKVNVKLTKLALIVGTIGTVYKLIYSYYVAVSHGTI